MARELIAKEQAFYRGVFLDRGDRFTFHGEKTPKWAGETLDPPKPPQRADTKPEAAAKAAKLKASGAADQVA